MVARASADEAAALRLLKTRCFSCHNEEKSKGGLVMTSRDALLKGGENGAALAVGNPEESAMIAALSPGADPHMPPKKQLSTTQIATLSAWVKAGAPWNASALEDAPRPVNLAPLPAAYRPVLAVALSPDGKSLAAGCGSEVVIYEVTEKGLIERARAAAHLDPVQSVTWSPDGARLATGAFRRVLVWNAHDLSLERELTSGLTDRITAVRFTPDGHRLIIADGRVAEHGTVRIADVAIGGVQTSWPAHADTIFDLAVSADGQLLATAGGDRLVKIWELASQREVGRIEGHSAQVFGLAFNSDATQLVTAGADQQLKAWDVRKGNQIMLLGKHSVGISAVAWAPTPSAIFAITDAGGLLRYTNFKPHTGAESSSAADERKMDAAETALHCVAVSATGDRIFAGSHDGRVLGWNKDGKLVTKLDVNAPKPATAAAR
ncbi:MAG: translocation protein TolB [Chthoniobacter sp.]|nr:translocation protein TolB [Chthoniobacter sp.]